MTIDNRLLMYGHYFHQGIDPFFKTCYLKEVKQVKGFK